MGSPRLTKNQKEKRKQTETQPDNAPQASQTQRGSLRLIKNTSNNIQLVDPTLIQSPPK